MIPFNLHKQKGMRKGKQKGKRRPRWRKPESFARRPGIQRFDLSIARCEAEATAVYVWNSMIRVLLVVFALSSVLHVGCNRQTYRLWADQDAYSLIASRQNDPLWTIPDRAIEPSPNSRLADDYDPDCGPQPPDDPSANDWLRRPYRFSNDRYWDQIGVADTVENSSWEYSLPVDENNEIVVDRATAIELALVHSRDYQAQIENLHLNALGLSANRFEFDTQWFGSTGTTYNGFGRNSFANRSIAQNSSLGFSRQLAAGGQIAASIANSLVWNLTPSGPTTTSSSILLSLTQPLLRGAFRHVRLESLSQAERSLLYDVRDFARFRRQFYLDITSTYLGLLTQTQSLRNQRSNLESLELSLQEFEELFDKGDVSQISVDQVFQDYQSTRIGLLASEQAYANSLDAFKFQLGLPPRVEIRIDESFLKPFELSDPAFDELRIQTDEAYDAMVQYLPPEVAPQELLDDSFASFVMLQKELQPLVGQVEEELQQWLTNLEEIDLDELDPEDAIDFRQQETLAARLQTQLVEVKQEIESDIENVEEIEEQFKSLDETEQWKLASELLGNRLRSQHSTLFVMQNQIRLFLIDVTPFDLLEPQAVEMALANRVDLMNQRGQTMDAWRNVEIAADALQSDLDVSTDVSIGTDPNFQNPVRFDSSNSSVQVGVQFDGPLNRFSERNGYRAAQIFYQQARRQYMASEDGVVNQIRSQLRGLRLSWLDFQISRQSLIAATRQVEEAQFQLRTQTTGDTSATRDLLQALQLLLGAKNSLISAWIEYEVGRIELFVNLELLYLDSEGTWTNEAFNPGNLTDSSSSNSLDDPNLPGTQRGNSNDSESTEPRFDEDSRTDGPNLDPIDAFDAIDDPTVLDYFQQ